MDFLTLFPYIGILVLVAINALLVLKRNIVVDESDHEPTH